MTNPAAPPLRTLDTRPAFWVAMFMASAFGANLGDFCADLAINRLVSFVVLTAICLVAIAVDRRAALRTEAAYWAAIIALRAAATNLADFFTHDLGLSYPTAALVLAALTLAAGLLTRAPRADAGSPQIDGRYWPAMALAGLFGTVAGDLASHTIGLYAASATLTALLLVLLAVRALAFPAALLAYWIAVLAERTAATPFGDMIDSHRALGLGLPISMAITLALFLVALLLRRSSRLRRSAAPA